MILLVCNSMGSLYLLLVTPGNPSFHFPDLGISVSEKEKVSVFLINSGVLLLF